MAYIGQEPGQGQAQRSIFTAVAVTDTVTADDDGLPLNYTVGQVSVYLNGVKQVVGDDVVASNGSTLVFASDYAIGDVIEVIALDTFSVGTVEGTALISTGESGGTKFLREDGDGTSSWQTVTPATDFVSAASGGTFSGDVTHNGNVIMATTKKVQQKGAFMQSSTHQALTLGA